MSKTIAAFPLSLVCFPGEIQNLHIFEPRYRNLIADCLSENITFALVPFINNKAFHLGTEMILHNVDKIYPDGKYDVSLKANRLIKVNKLFKKLPDKEYPGVKMTPLSWDETPDYSLSEKIIELVQKLYRIISISDKVPNAENFLVSKIVHKIGLSIEQELTLLGLSEERERQVFVLEHLEKFVPTVEKANDLRLKAVLNGHFKNINPANF